MKITFSPMSASESEKTYTDKKQAAKEDRGYRAYGTGFSVERNEAWPIGTACGKEKGKSFIELQQEAGNVDVAVQQDYMTVMSHTMSEEDYAELSREGFRFESLNPEQAVTIVDKIKAELARSGKQIVGYTDDINMDTLAAALGSDALARTIADSFARSDIPMTRENIDSVVRAWDMASQLETPGEGDCYYMLDNELEPEIWNFYLAQSSGAENMTGSSPRYYAEEIQGYLTRGAEEHIDENLQLQIDNMIANAGIDVTEESRQQAQWLLQKGLPLTVENLKRLNELQAISVPITEETFARAVSSAIAEGRKPIHADLTQGETIYERAAGLAQRYYQNMLSILPEGDIAARRQLEEIRLRMTAEVNVKLLKSGFSIDTAPMEQLLDALKQAEVQLADTYFPNDGNAVGKYELYHRTEEVVNELPGLPLQMIGIWTDRAEQENIRTFHEEGMALCKTYQKAGESYETLMTAPRSDLGDSIRKAFGNVDEILTDMGYELTEENQRAVRILGYNRMAMNESNLEAVKAVDQQVCSVVEKMTPAAVLKMIRDGINPLESSFEELENYFTSLPEEYEESAESYSRFLYHLEQNKEISGDERKEYISVFRLLRQVEKSDGAVIGTLVNQGMDTAFKSLLTAVKSRRFKHMDVRVSDSEIADKQYTRMLWEQTRQAAKADADSAALLLRGELPANAGNLLAARALLQDVASPYKKWQEKVQKLSEQSTAGSSETSNVSGSDETSSAEEMTSMSGIEEQDVDLEAVSYREVWEQLSDRTAFQSAYNEMLSELSSQVERVSLLSADSSLDVREMQMIHKQLSVAASLAGSEEYILPMYIGEELAKVHLTLEQGSSRKGEVSVQVDISQNMHVEAHFSVRENKLQGFLVGNTGEEVTKLQKTADIFLELVKQEENQNLEIEELPIVNSGSGRSITSNSIGRNRTGDGNKDEVTNQQVVSQKTTNAELYRVAKLFLQAVR